MIEIQVCVCSSYILSTQIHILQQSEDILAGPYTFERLLEGFPCGLYQR